MSGSRSDAWADMRADAEEARRNLVPDSYAEGCRRLEAEMGIMDTLRADLAKAQDKLTRVTEQFRAMDHGPDCEPDLCECGLGDALAILEEP
jgi:hypothetical protein